MADVHTMPGCSPPPPPAPTPAPISVQGWDWDSLGAPPVIVNPNATHNSLESWALGQLRQLNRLLEIIGCSDPAYEYSAADIVGSIRHFTEQVETVLRAAHDLPHSAAAP